MKKSTFANVAAAGLLVADLFSASSASASATALDLRSGYATFGHDYALSTASFMDEYRFSAGSDTPAYLAGTYTEGNAAIQEISWFKINDDRTRTSPGGSFGLAAPLVAGHYGFDVMGHSLLANHGGTNSGTLGGDAPPVPEPDAFAMAAVGLGLVCFRRRPRVNPKLG